jgi:hypothetical protein
MSDMPNNQAVAPVPAADEKLVSLVVYTASHLYVGDLLIKNMIRVNTWLRTNMAPDTIHLYNGKCIQTTGDGSNRPMVFSELFIPTAQLIAYHLMPPLTEPPDYDPKEPNRRMEPVCAIVGPFRIDASIRIASKSSLVKYIELSREIFSGLYDAEITHPTMASFGKMRVPFVIVRQNNAVFAARLHTA